MPRGKSRLEKTCTAPGCTSPQFTRGLCNKHYKRSREPFQPRCSVEGCGRRSNGFNRCVHHRHDPHRVVHPVRRPAGPERRVLAWGRLPITREAARLVEQEAKRRNLSPSGLMAAIVESWAEARADAPPSRRLTVCRAPGCERAVYARGLCRPHEVQEREGKALRPVQERVADKVLMGSIRLPVGTAHRLKASAEAAGIALTEALRRTLAATLDDPRALASAWRQKRRGETFRLGQLRLPASLAERLNVVAQELGISVSEVIRRAVEAGR